MNEVVLDIIGIVISIISTVITSVLLPQFTKWIKSKVESEQIRSCIDDLNITVTSAVDYFEQTVVSKLKSDDNWSEETQKDTLNAVADEVFKCLCESTKHTIESQGASIYDVIIRHIESYIISQKKN